MEENLDKKIEIKEGISLFYKKNKLKIFITLGIIILALLVLVFLEIYKKKENNLVSEKYIQAGIYLASEEKEKAKNIYEEIIYDKNNFYSPLALSLIIEKNLVSDQKKLFEYFDIIEKITKKKEQLNLIKIKKALYLIKSERDKEGKNILEKISNSNSKYKNLAKDLLTQ